MEWQKTEDAIEISIGSNEDDGIYEYFSTPFYVSNVCTDLLSGDEHIKIILEGLRTGNKLLEVSNDAISSGIVRKMAGKGFTMLDTPENNEIVSAILMESKADAIWNFKHDKLGFVKGDNGEKFFLLYHPVGEKDRQKSSSVYVNEEVKPKGCFSGWKHAVNRIVYGKGHMELALAIGAVAPIAHILLEQKVIKEIPMIAMVGNSSSGKTTSLILQSSIWFSQEMIGDFNCTQTAFVTQMSQSKGLPMLVDEASAVADWDFTGLLYNLPKGKSRGRCKQDGSLQKRVCFSGIVVLTGEKSFFNQTLQYRGLEARLLELTLPWTESAEHADNIVCEFSRHYGVAAQPLMQWILTNKSQLKSVYLKRLKELQTRCSTFKLDSVQERLLKIPALIVTAAEVMNVALGLELNVATIIETLVEVMRQKSEEIKNTPEYWREKLMYFVSDNAGKFPNRAKVDDAHKIWGFKDLYHLAEVMWIRADIYEKVIADICNEDIKDANRLLADKKYILRDDRHYKFDKRLRGASLKCYGLFLNKPPKKMRKIKRNMVNENKKKSLLED